MEPLAALLSVVCFGQFLSATMLDFVMVGVAGIMATVSVKELLPEVRNAGRRCGHRRL